MRDCAARSSARLTCACAGQDLDRFLTWEIVASVSATPVVHFAILLSTQGLTSFTVFE